MGLIFHEDAFTPGGTQSAYGSYDGYAVTPSDSADLPNGPCQALYVTGAGNVNVQLDADSTGVLALAANDIYPIQVTRVMSTSTTATGIFALYRKGG